MAEADLAFTLEDNVMGFGWAITLTSPAGDTTTDLYGQSNDIGHMINPETGMVVSGRHAEIVIRLQTLYDQGFTIPKGIADSRILPWRVSFDDINGESYTFKVYDSIPDRQLGMVKLILETWKV